MMTLRFGIDFGGTKTEIVALDQHGCEVYRHRISTDRDSYDAIIANITTLVTTAEEQLGSTGTVGVGIPGSLHPQTQVIHNSNSVVTNGRAMGQDLSLALKREVRISNDANCFAMSEAIDGAAKNSSVVFGVIIGTGCGGGFVVNKQLLVGGNGIAGEWGHNPLPYPQAKTDSGDSAAIDYFDSVGKQERSSIYQNKNLIEPYAVDWANTEYPGAQCYCGKRGCLETWLSGTGFANDYARVYGDKRDTKTIIEAMRAGDERAQQAFKRYCQRLAKALAQVINIIDPDVIVLGGGLSNVDEIYEQVPQLWQDFVFAASSHTEFVPAFHGDSSGVRGAAWLWNDEGP